MKGFPVRRKTNRMIAWSLIALVLLLAAGAVLASPGAVEMGWKTISSGGSRASSASRDVVLQGSLAQPAAEVSSAGGTSLGSGFWSGITQSNEGGSGFEVYVPVLLED